VERAGARDGPSRLERALEGVVHLGGKERRFGELGAGEARAYAEELKRAGNWGPLMRAAKVARAWSELAAALERAGAASVAELDPEAVLDFAERVWVIPPEEGLI
jgi:hypothetical protein